MHVTLRQLRAFLIGTNSASFSDAAGRANLTQPGFSLLIRQLETELGVRLFDRTTRRAKITHAGRAFSDALAHILTQLDELLDNTRAEVARQRGHVTIGVLPSVAATFAATIYARIQAEFPDVTVTLREEQAGPLVHLVSDNVIDFGIGVDLQPEHDISFTPLMHDRMVFLLHPDVPILEEEDASWQSVFALPYIAFARSSVRERVGQALADVGIEVEPVMEVDFMSTAAQMVRAKLGFAIVPELALGMTDVSGLRIVPMQPTVQRRVGILSNNQHSLSPTAQVARQVTREVAIAYDRRRRAIEPSTRASKVPASAASR